MGTTSANVLLSRLDLADGPLMAYDIQRLAAAPREVVLSACEIGRTVVRAGDEVLGFTAALRYAGTATVISSVTRLRVGIMTAYHRALRAGARPAEALSEAACAEPFSPFVAGNLGAAFHRCRGRNLSAAPSGAGQVGRAA
jgi:CHAT domain-containing protein